MGKKRVGVVVPLLLLASLRLEVVLGRGPE